MTLLDLGEGVLRVFGCFYVAGALVLANQLRMNLFLDKALDQLNRMSAELAAESGESSPAPTANDGGRTLWMIAGAVLTFAAGVTMALGLRVAVIALGLLVLHQLAYFVRQRQRELRAANAEEAEDARPTQATRNGFMGCLVLFVLAAWLERSGVLS